jgi:hypothetical protein
MGHRSSNLPSSRNLRSARPGIPELDGDGQPVDMVNMLCDSQPPNLNVPDNDTIFSVESPSPPSRKSYETISKFGE